MRIPFEPYDFFGYVASGLLVVVAMDLTLGFPSVLDWEFKPVEAALLILAVYIAGQMVATPAKATLEDLVVGRILGRPSQNLLSATKPFFWRIIFPGFYRALPAQTQSRIVTRVKEEGVDGSGEALFLHIRYHPRLLTNERLMMRLSNFLNLYGFARNLAFTSFCVGAILLIAPREPEAGTEHTRYAFVALTAAVLLLYRYLKFFRQYSYELFNTYAELD